MRKHLMWTEMLSGHLMHRWIYLGLTEHSDPFRLDCGGRIGHRDLQATAMASISTATLMPTGEVSLICSVQTDLYSLVLYCFIIFSLVVFPTFPAIGISFNCSSNIYCGTQPISEPEAQAVTYFVGSRAEDFLCFLTIHSYGQLLLVPYGHPNFTAPNYDELVFTSTNMAMHWKTHLP